MATDPHNTSDTGRLGRDTLISKTISVLRWPLAFLVVIDHYFRLHLIEECCGADVIDARTISGIEAFIISFLKNYPVPIFFFISGYLLYLGDKSPGDNYRSKLRKFPREIIFPYVFWTLYAIGVSLIIGLSQGFETQHLLQIPQDGKFLPGPIKWIVTTFIGTTWPANLPLWYVRDLALIIVFAPVIHRMLKLSRGWVLLFMGIIFVTFNNDNAAIRFTTGIFFFSLGYWMRYKGSDVPALARKIFTPALAIYLCGATFYFVGYDIKVDDTTGMPWFNCFMKNIAVIGFLPVAFHIASICVSRKWFTVKPKLVAASFFVYVTHYPIHHTVIAFFSTIFIREGDGALAALVAASVATPILLTLIYLLLRKLSPAFIRVIDGR